MPRAMPIDMLVAMKTTVSLESSLRDRLAELAARHGRTMGEQIAAMVEVAEGHDFWDRVSAGYADLAQGVEVVVHDDYPEYAHLRVGRIAAEGEHNEPDRKPRRARRAAA
jgi:predicted transcriptional regulator